MSKMHPKLKEILDMPGNPDAVSVETQDPDEAREEWKADMAAVDATSPRMAEVTDITLATQAGDVAARCYVPDGLSETDRPCLIYYHGGGFIRGDLDTHDSICRVLARSTPCMVISVEYRKPPENRFPAALDDAYAAAEFIASHSAQFNVDPARIAVGGDSAGGNLAASVCLAARDRERPSIAAQLLIYPVTDLVTETESKRFFSSGYLLDSMPFYISSYLGPEGDGADPLASPLLADSHASLPPAIVITAGFDPLRDEGVAYAEKLEKEGIDVLHTRYPDMIHGFVSLRGILEEADKALEQAGAQLAVSLVERPK